MNFSILIPIVIMIVVYRFKVHNYGYKVANDQLLRTLCVTVFLIGITFMLIFWHASRNINNSIRYYTLGAVGLVVLFSTLTVVYRRGGVLTCLSDVKTHYRDVMNKSTFSAGTYILITFMALCMFVTSYTYGYMALDSEYPMAEPMITKYYNMDRLQIALLKSLPFSYRNDIYEVSDMCGVLLTENSDNSEVEEYTAKVNKIHLKYEVLKLLFWLFTLVCAHSIALYIIYLERNRVLVKHRDTTGR